MISLENETTEKQQFDISVAVPDAPAASNEKDERNLWRSRLFSHHVCLTGLVLGLGKYHCFL